MVSLCLMAHSVSRHRNPHWILPVQTGFITQQLLIKFKRGRTVKHHGKLTWELKSLQEQLSFSLGLHVLLYTVFWFPCLIWPLSADQLSVCSHMHDHQWLSWSLFDRTLQLQGPNLTYDLCLSRHRNNQIGWFMDQVSTSFLIKEGWVYVV